MKLATYRYDGSEKPRFGYKRKNYIVDIEKSAKWIGEKSNDKTFMGIPSTLKEALNNWEINFKKITHLNQIIADKDINENNSIACLETDCEFLPPIPNPQSFRDFYAFEQHVRSARKLRGLDMHPDWFKIPIFYLLGNY